MDFNKTFQSKAFKVTLYAIGGLVVFLLVLKAGMFIGYKKANFSYRWGENYHRNFAGPRGGFFGELNDRDFIDAYGSFGQIIKVDTTTNPEQTTIVMKGRDNVEKIILVNEKTAIKSMRDTMKLTDLKVDDNIVVIGEPNETGQIEAKLIRIMPALPSAPPGFPGRPGHPPFLPQK